MKLRTTLVCCLAIAAATGCAVDVDKGAVDTEGFALSGSGSADDARGIQTIGYNERVMDALSPRNAYDLFRIENGRCDDAFIDLASREGGDTYLLLYVDQGRGWELADVNDDCRGSTNSCLETAFDADNDYMILASSYDYLARRRRPMFTYELEVVCRDVPEPTEQYCGSRGLEPCPDRFFCDWAEDGMCGADDRPGVCRPLPGICPEIYAPVCGCDGRTYSNTCFAHSHGIDVASRGECERPGNGEGEICGGIAGFTCEEGLRCDMSANEFCGADLAGVCTSVVMFCTANYDPVCGCDGRTYSNDCHRRNAGAALDYRGECR